MRLWSCVSNYYVKTFAGWLGDPLCNPSPPASSSSSSSHWNSVEGEQGGSTLPTAPSSISPVAAATAAAASRTSDALRDGPHTMGGGGDEGCVGGVGRLQLARAKEVLEKEFHAVLITEWLNHEAQVQQPNKY